MTTVRVLAELVALTRAAFPGKAIHTISARTGDGVAEWLAAVLDAESAGANIVDVDYDVYAEGEAVLGWLNAAATLTATAPVDWPAVSLRLLAHIQAAAQTHRAEIAHVKLALTAPGGQYVANLTSTDSAPVIHGAMDGAPRQVALVLNARVEMAPDTLQTIVEDALRALADQVSVHVETLRSLSPGRPTPTHRYARVG